MTWVIVSLLLLGADTSAAPPTWLLLPAKVDASLGKGTAELANSTVRDVLVARGGTPVPDARVKEMLAVLGVTDVRGEEFLDVAGAFEVPIALHATVAQTPSGVRVTLRRYESGRVRLRETDTTRIGLVRALREGAEALLRGEGKIEGEPEPVVAPPAPPPIPRKKLGVRTKPIVEAMVKRLTLPAGTGARAIEVAADGAGAAAGIWVDDVLISFAGKPIVASDLGRLVAEADLRGPTAIELWRDGLRMTVQVYFGEGP